MHGQRREMDEGETIEKRSCLQRAERQTATASFAFAFFRVTSARSCENLAWHGPPIEYRLTTVTEKFRLLRRTRSSSDDARTARCSLQREGTSTRPKSTVAPRYLLFHSDLTFIFLRVTDSVRICLDSASGSLRDIAVVVVDALSVAARVSVATARIR